MKNTSPTLNTLTLKKKKKRKKETLGTLKTIHTVHKHFYIMLLRVGQLYTISVIILTCIYPPVYTKGSYKIKSPMLPFQPLVYTGYYMI